MHFKPQRTKLFCGRVIDGPFEGDWIENDSPYCEGQFCRRLPDAPAYSGDLPRASIEIDRVIYKWLSSYRAWAWMQPQKGPLT
jgi:hypothetical protein